MARSRWVTGTSTVAVVVVAYFLCLRFVFPGYFAPFVPHHSDMYIPVGLLERPVTEIMTFPRPVANMVLRTIGIAGVAGSITIVVGFVLAGVVLTWRIALRLVGSPPSLVAVCLYVFLLFAHPQFYFQHRHDVPAAVSYLLMLSAALLAERWAVTHSRQTLAAYMVALAALGLTKETYVVATLVFVTGMLAARHWDQRMRVARLLLISAVVLGAAIAFNLIRYRHFLAAAMVANQPYQPSFHPSTILAALTFYLRLLLSPAALALLVVTAAGLWPDRRRLIMSGVLITAGVCALLPHATLPNHLEDHYAWVAAPLVFAPILFIELRGRRGLAIAAMLIAACAVWVTANRNDYAAPNRRWAIMQEKANANILASLPVVQGLNPVEKHILVTGLTASYHPWLSSDFVRHELGRGRSWTVLVRRDSPQLMSPPVTLASPRRVDITSFDSALVYDADSRLTHVISGRQIAELPADVVLVPELKSHLEILQHHPQDFMSLLRTGILYSEWGWPERSIEYFNRAISAGPDNPYPPFFLGQAMEALGKRDDARKYYAEAIARDTPPGNDAFRQALESLESKQR